MTSPYREAPIQIGCPRCGEAMEQIDRDVQRCLGCHGLWCRKTILDAAVRDWRQGASTWWHAEMNCPEPHAQAQLLTPRTRAGVTIDVCNDHGAWFDQGELARILRSDGDDLAALRGVLPSLSVEVGNNELSVLERELDESREELRRVRHKIATLEQRIAALKALKGSR
ncbi:MAG TPA: hypothetical protein VGC41_05620 [Kofleriaceae bacterium]